jgi:hypothetical protein
MLDPRNPYFSLVERAKALGMPVPSMGDAPFVLFEKCLAVMLAEIEDRLSRIEREGK